MAFNIQKFRDAKVKQRIKEVEVKELAPFFDDEQKPIVKLRNLTGHEIAACNEAVTTNKQLRATIEKILSGNPKEKADGICDQLGISDRTPDDLVKRFNLLRFGCVEPELAHEDCVRFASIFPVIFYDLTNQIINLTGLGAELGE